MKLFLSIGILFWLAVAALAYRTGSQALVALIGIGAPVALIFLVAILHAAGRREP